MTGELAIGLGALALAFPVLLMLLLFACRGLIDDVERHEHRIDRIEQALAATPEQEARVREVIREEMAGLGAGSPHG